MCYPSICTFDVCATLIGWHNIDPRLDNCLCSFDKQILRLAKKVEGIPGQPDLTCPLVLAHCYTCPYRMKYYSAGEEEGVVVVVVEEESRNLNDMD